ncbi:hypothetical protein DXG01_016923 [Tephrocybe rancida]|nr:hypothetical protein DXG01_016923 [Tephrocybe rancida]
MCTPTPLVDHKGQIIGHLVGHPDNPDWPLVHKEAAELLEAHHHTILRSKGSKKHQQGKFPAIPYGVTHGGGRTVPGNCPHSPEISAALKTLNTSPFFQRIACFASAVFATWAPRLYAYYCDCLGALFAHDLSLSQNFLGSMFAATTYNFGPCTTTFLHTDAANLHFGWCAVTALWNFNPKRGGHLVLWDCGVIIEFPAGSTILIPSAVIAHMNVAIGKGETHYLYTQYSAGGLFRWVEHGYKKNEEYFASLTPDELKCKAEEDKRRWSEGINMFSTLADICPPLI